MAKTISKISVDGVDYSVADLDSRNAIFNVGAHLTDGQDLNDLNTVGTVYYCDADSGTIKNSPTELSFKLVVSGDPSGVSGTNPITYDIVIQTVYTYNAIISRIGYLDNGTYKWGSWGFANQYDSGWVKISDNLQYRVSGQVVTVFVSVTSNGTTGTPIADVLGTSARPSRRLRFPCAYTTGSAAYVDIKPDGSVYVGGGTSGAVVEATCTYVVNNMTASS